jgi:hypothetical protein
MTSLKSVKNQGIADRIVHIKVVFRKIFSILYLIPKLFRGNLARNVLSNFAKKLTHVPLHNMEYILILWQFVTIEKKEGWGKKFVTIKLWQMPLFQSQITLSNNYSTVCYLTVVYLGKLLKGFWQWNTIEIKQLPVSAVDGQMILKSFNIAHLSLTMSVSLSGHISSNNNSITNAWIFIGLNILELH